MDFILTLLMFAFGGLILLAASPVIIYKLGKKYFKNLINPYEKTVTSFSKIEYPGKQFLIDFSKSNLFVMFLKNNKLSSQSISILLTYMESSQRLLFLRTMPKETAKQIDDFLKKNKKAKSNILETTKNEIKSLLEEEIKLQSPSEELLLFYYYDELFEDVQKIKKEKENTNHVVQHQIDQIIKRTLTLLPLFEKYQLFEMSHKFKTLLQKDLKESIHLLSSIESSQKLDKEAELYAVLKSILKEIEEIENKFNSNNEDELTKRMRILKDKFKLQIDEE